MKKDARPRKGKGLAPSLFCSTECLKLTSRCDFIDPKSESISVTEQGYFIGTIVTNGLLFGFPVFASFTAKKKIVLKAWDNNKRFNVLFGAVALNHEVKRQLRDGGFIVKGAEIDEKNLRELLLYLFSTE